MGVLELLKSCGPVRKYKRVEVPEEKLKKVLNAMRYAPSAENCQPWKFIIVKMDDIKAKLRPACNNRNFVAEAPIVIIGCASINDAYPYVGMYMSSYPIDLAMALNSAQLVAAEEGLGSCWLWDFHDEKLRDILDIPDDMRVVFVMTLGIPDEDAEKSSRKHLNEIIMYDKYEIRS